MAYISLGHFDKYYFLILGIVSIKFLTTFINGFYPTLTPNDPIFLFGFRTNFISHPFLKNTFEYFGIGLIGLILEYIFFKNSKEIGQFKEEEFTEEVKEENDSKIERTATVAESILLNRKISYTNLFSKNKKLYLNQIFWVFICFYFGRMTINTLDSIGFHQAKFWEFECIFLYFFSQKILGQKIYKHQILALLITLIFSTLFYTTNTLIPESNMNCDELEDKNSAQYNECISLTSNVYKKIIDLLYWIFIPIIIIVYLTAIGANLYTSVKNKWFIDINYISIFKIMTYIGASGFILSLLLLLIFSFIPCSKNLTITNNICFIQYDEGSIYYANFRAFKYITADKKLFLEIFLLMPLYIILGFLNYYFELLIIKNLDPFYILPIENIYYLIYQAIDFFSTLSITNSNNNIKFILQTLANIISVISSCIYLEIIELHFYELDKNIKRLIIHRGKMDNLSTELVNKIVNDKQDNDNENDDNPDEPNDPEDKNKDKEKNKTKNQNPEPPRIICETEDYIYEIV